MRQYSEYKFFATIWIFNTLHRLVRLLRFVLGITDHDHFLCVLFHTDKEKQFIITHEDKGPILQAEVWDQAQFVTARFTTWFTHSLDLPIS